MRRGLVDIEWIALSLQAQAKALSGQVAILDAHVELLIDRLAEDQDENEFAVEQVVGVSPPACDHAEDFRLEAGSMRAPLRFFCKACRRFVDPGAPSSDLPASPPRSPVDA
jgi:hypothetical protein